MWCLAGWNGHSMQNSPGPGSGGGRGWLEVTCGAAGTSGTVRNEGPGAGAAGAGSSMMGLGGREPVGPVQPVY